MEVFETVRTVLAVRRYRDRRVPPEVIARIVEAGRLSASSQNLQPWHFVVVEERATLRAIGEIIKTGRYAADASFAIAVFVEKESHSARSDASRAIQNMILTAWSEGIGSNWTGFGAMPAIQQLLSVPESHGGLAVLPFGYPAAKLGAGRKERKPIGEVASSERFGTPFA
jgi:nitroreductase